jgi:hypothetical protein
MSEAPVRGTIVGIGPITEKHLANIGVTTVGQLAKLNPIEVDIPNISKLISYAKKYLEKQEDNTDTKSVKENSTPNLVLGTTTWPNINKATIENIKNKAKNMPVEKPEPKVEKKVSKEDEENKYLLQSHSWWENRILLPKIHGEEEELVEALIYELSLEPGNRISFLCSWYVQSSPEEKQEKVCTMTFSPQFIYYFNTHLPPLEVSIRPDDFELLPNNKGEILRNVLLETNLMNRYTEKEDR